jgi:hypothetical protein
MIYSLGSGSHLRKLKGVDGKAGCGDRVSLRARCCFFNSRSIESGGGGISKLALEIDFDLHADRI